MNSKQNVGYIGLGNIGKPSAIHLTKGEFKLHVYDVYRPALDELVAEGATACEALAELARQCTHIGICVRDDAQVESILYGTGGLLANGLADSIIAIHSTVSRAALARWASDAASHGIHLIDAGISGGAASAAAGTLVYMVGGESEIVARVTPVFETSASSVIHAGALGSGMLLKLCNNMITYAELMAMSEATKLAEAGGLSADILREVGLTNGIVNEAMHAFVTNRNALSVSTSRAAAEPHFDALGRLSEKDLDCALECAQELGVTLPSTAHLRKTVYPMFMNED
jgi:3-hydroxyisobutyrate dehydrogenase